MKTLTTGDILLCSGNSSLSNSIKRYQKITTKGRNLGKAVNLSHVAGIIQDWDGQPWVYESTTHNKWAADGAGKKGTQINPFDEWLKNYDGDVWCRKFNGVIVDQQTFIWHAIQSQAIPYENGIPGKVELLLTELEWKWLNEIHRITKQPHCTEAWAMMLMQPSAGVLSAKTVPSKLPPCEWWGNGKLEALLVEGYSYSEPRLIKEGE